MVVEFSIQLMTQFRTVLDSTGQNISANNMHINFGHPVNLWAKNRDVKYFKWLFSLNCLRSVSSEVLLEYPYYSNMPCM